MHIRIFAYVDPAEGSVDVYIFVVIGLAVFLYVDAAADEQEKSCSQHEDG
jgi:hypothetical protein